MKTKSIFRSFVICLFLLALMPAAISSAAPAASNLAPNPSFERGRKQVVKAWSPMDAAATFTWARGNAYSGNRSVCIGNVANNSYTAWNTNEYIPVSQGTDYVLSAYAKGDFDGRVYLGIWAKDASGTITDHTLVPMTFDNATWTFTQTTYRPAASTVAVRLELAVQEMSTATTTPSICFDYVSFEGFAYPMP